MHAKYANYKGARKYDRTMAIVRNDRGTGPQKAKSAKAAVTGKLSVTKAPNTRRSTYRAIRKLPMEQAPEQLRQRPLLAASIQPLPLQ